MIQSISCEVVRRFIIFIASSEYLVVFSFMVAFIDNGLISFMLFEK